MVLNPPDVTTLPDSHRHEQVLATPAAGARLQPTTHEAEGQRSWWTTRIPPRIWSHADHVPSVRLGVDVARDETSLE